MRKTVAGLMLATLLSTGFATAANADYWARNRMRAADVPGQPGLFEVFQKATAGAPDYWCVAGEYTRYQLHQHNTTRIYLVRGLGPSLAWPGRKAVLFSYVKRDDLPDLSVAEKGYSVSIRKPGYHLSAGHSSAFCAKSVRRFMRRGLY